MIRRVREIAAGLLVAGLLAACASTPPTAPRDREAAWAQRRAQLQALDGWQASGRLSVRSGRKARQANFDWRETAGGDGFRLELSGPWGVGATRLVENARAVRLTTHNGQQYRGHDAASLIRRLYGLDIPVAGLRHWLIGLPGDTAAYRLDRFGRLDTIDWRDWHIEYRAYQENGAIELPTQLVATRSHPSTHIRVAISHWQPAGGSVPVEDSPIPLIGGGENP